MPGVIGLSVSVSAESDASGPCTVMRLVGEADLNTQLLREVLSAEAARKPRLLLVDMSGLTFIDSAALHEIVRAHRKLRADGCLLALVSPSPIVTRILQLTGLDQVLPIRASAREEDPR